MRGQDLALATIIATRRPSLARGSKVEPLVSAVELQAAALGIAISPTP